MFVPYYCLECGGDLTYDPTLKQYICKSCGLTFTMQQLIESRDISDNSKKEEKKQRQNDYLKWWLSKK